MPANTVSGLRAMMEKVDPLSDETLTASVSSMSDSSLLLRRGNSNCPTLLVQSIYCCREDLRVRGG